MADNKREIVPWTIRVIQVLGILVLLALVAAMVAVSAGGVDYVKTKVGGTHGSAAVYGFSLVCTFLSLWLVLAAVFAYLNIGQEKKIEVIIGFYNPDTIADYFDQFWIGRDGIRKLVADYRAPTASAEAGTNLEKKLRDLFESDFGIVVYVIPVILLVMAGGIVLFFGFTGGIGLAVAQSMGSAPPVQPFGIKLDLVSVAAIFGAYTWIASDVIVRNYQWTLHPSDLGWYALRLIIAVPLGQALAMVALDPPNVTNGALATGVTAGKGAFLAFVINLFSLDAITTALVTTATRFGVPMKSGDNERDDLVAKLPGVDDARARALSVEGVTTIAQLVAVDPIRISIRSGLSFEYVLNLIDAALLWVFVSDKSKMLALSQLGLRGASDVLDLDDAWNTTVATTQAAWRQAVAAAAQATQGKTQAQAALDAEQAKAAPDPGAVAALTQALTAATAAATAAEAARVQAQTVFLAAPAGALGVAVDRQAMLTALQNKENDGGPELTAIGFDSICERLQKDSYAKFIRRLRTSS